LFLEDVVRDASVFARLRKNGEDDEPIGEEGDDVENAG
jgi:hypothetical protein